MKGRPQAVLAKKPAASDASPGVRGRVQFGPPASGGHRTVLFGTGGVGKTTLCCSIPGRIGLIDLDESYGRLAAKFAAWGWDNSNVQPVAGVTDWKSLRAVLQSDGWDDVAAIVIDTATRAEEFAVAHVLETVPLEGGKGKAKSIEDYGYGKGYQHVFDAFLPLLSDLDRHAREGRHVVLVCHDCSATVPNPKGADWLQYQPRLQTSNTGKASIRLRVKEWADHVLFLGYDVDVNRDGKGQGGGSVALYPKELPFAMAKSRTLVNEMSLDDCYAQLWPKLFV